MSSMEFWVDIKGRILLNCKVEKALLSENQLKLLAMMVILDKRLRFPSGTTSHAVYMQGQLNSQPGLGFV